MASTINTRTLEAQIVVACVRIDPMLATMGKVEVAHAVSGELVVQLRRYVYRERLGTRTVTVPANWVESVKERFAPAWLLRRYPLQTRDLTAELMASYPDFIPPSGIQPVVRVMEFKGFGSF